MEPQQEKTAYQPCLWFLSENILRKGKNDTEADKKGEKCEKQSCKSQEKKDVVEVVQAIPLIFTDAHGEELGESGYFPAVHGEKQTKVDIHPAARKGLHTKAVGYFPKELWPTENLHWSRFFPDGLQPMEGSTSEQEKIVKKKEWQNSYGLTINPCSPFSAQLHFAGWVSRGWTRLPTTSRSLDLL